MRTSASVITEAGFTSLKHRSGLQVVGVVGFARSWLQLGLRGAMLAQTVADARATIYHELADRQRRYGDRLVIASGATNVGVGQLAYEMCARLNITAMGIAPDQALDFPLGRMDYLLPFGQTFGDESPVFVRMIDEMLVMGGGAQSEREIFAAAADNRPMTIIQGFGGIADQLTPAVLPAARFVRRISSGKC
jgi:hypothetical protein